MTTRLTKAQQRQSPRKCASWIDFVVWNYEKLQVNTFQSVVPQWNTSITKNKINLLIFYLLDSTFAVQKLWSYVPFRIRRSYVYFKFDEYFPTDQLWSILTETSSAWVTSLLHRSINWSSSPRLLPLVNHRMWLDDYLKKHPSFPPQPGWLIQYGCHSITVGWPKKIPFFLQSLNHSSSSPPCS